ncbi:hypothetical protein OZD68_02130 [Wolbachia endosymbiont of Drosophila bicornuta]|nr:hypothetical protein [Wolbachia endosymbiont of Drosophila bicornuta]MDE5056392.1 hypothetical protein [Wolbachia endosymbiont of Drosophila bicornuta]
MLLLYHSHKHISYPIRTIARSAIKCNLPWEVKVCKRYYLYLEKR